MSNATDEATATVLELLSIAQDPVDFAKVIATEWTLLVVSGLVILKRLFVRRSSAHKGLTLSDYLVVLGWIMVAIAVSLDTSSLALGRMVDGDDVTDDGSSAQLLQLIYVDDLISDMCFYFSKFSLLALYFELISPAFPRLRIALYCITYYTLIGFMVTIAMDTLSCMPVEQNWHIGSECVIFQSETVASVNWAFNISSDVAIFILPFFLLHHLSLSRGLVIGITAMFCLGGLTILCSIARFTVNYMEAIDDSLVYILYTTEANVSLIVVSMPILRRGLHLHSHSNTSQHAAGPAYEYSDDKVSGNSSAGSAASGRSRRMTLSMYSPSDLPVAEWLAPTPLRRLSTL